MYSTYFQSFCPTFRTYCPIYQVVYDMSLSLPESKTFRYLRSSCQFSFIKISLHGLYEYEWLILCIRSSLLNNLVSFGLIWRLIFYLLLLGLSLHFSRCLWLFRHFLEFLSILINVASRKRRCEFVSMKAFLATTSVLIRLGLRISNFNVQVRCFFNTQAHSWI